MHVDGALSRFGRTRSRARRWPCLVVAGVVLCVCVGTWGCAQRVTYHPASLPAEFVAPHRENIDEVGLSGLNNVAASSEMVERGDLLEVTMVTDFRNLAASTVPVRVAEDGTAMVPMIGPVTAAGLDLDEVEQEIKRAGVERGVFKNPLVTVTMKRQRKNRVTVTGAVKEPAVYELPRSNSTLLAALVAAGGLAEDAGPEVEIRNPLGHGGASPLAPPRAPRVAEAEGAELTSWRSSAEAAPGTIRVDLASARQQGHGAYYVDDGSVIQVPKRTLKPIMVLGLVHKPGQYDLPPNHDLYLMDALALAGGPSMNLADKVLIIRQIPGQAQPIRIQASIYEAKRNGQANLRVAPGDVISVEDTPLTVLWDGVRSLLRIGITGGVSLF